MFVTRRRLRKQMENMQKAVKIANEGWSNAIGERNRAVDAACGLEDLVAQKEREIEELKAKNVMLQNTVDSMRWRIFTLLRSTDVDAEAIGLPRYTKPEADELRSVEEICEEEGVEPIREIDPGEKGWWPKEGLFEQSGDNPYIEVEENIELSEAPEGQDIISAAKRAIEESLKKMDAEKLRKILKGETWEEQLGDEL